MFQKNFLSPSLELKSEPLKKHKEAGGRLLVSCSAYSFNPEDGGSGSFWNIGTSLHIVTSQKTISVVTAQRSRIPVALAFWTVFCLFRRDDSDARRNTD
jgi:hypothetical protein